MHIIQVQIQMDSPGNTSYTEAAAGGVGAGIRGKEKYSHKARHDDAGLPLTANTPAAA